MSEAPTTTETPSNIKSPVKKHHEAIVYAFGQPLESFENNSANQKPTDLDIIRHWMYLEGQKNPSNSVNIVTDNLIAFYTRHHPSVELRYLCTNSFMISKFFFVNCIKFSKFLYSNSIQLQDNSLFDDIKIS